VRIGVDSYAYHRLLGDVRAGEEQPTEYWFDGLADVLAEAQLQRAEVVSVQTCFVGRAADVPVTRLASAAALLEVIPAWGAPEGLRYGADSDALADLLGWIELAAAADCRMMRIVLGGPRLRLCPGFAERLPGVTEPLRVVARAARGFGVRLAVENHGDITTTQLLRVLEDVDAPDVLGVCFDTANALRVGEDAVSAAAAVAECVDMVHLKDVGAPHLAQDPVAGPYSVPFGQGVVPLDDVLDVLSAKLFAGPVCVELGQLPPGAEERRLVGECLNWLRARRRRALSSHDATAVDIDGRPGHI